jgi:hypothetical protein
VTIPSATFYLFFASTTSIVPLLMLDGLKPSINYNNAEATADELAPVPRTEEQAIGATRQHHPGDIGSAQEHPVGVKEATRRESASLATYPQFLR